MERNCWRSKCWLTVLSILLLVAGYSGTVYSQSTGSSTVSAELGVFVLGDPVWVRDRKMYISETLFNLGGPLPVRYLYNGHLDIAPIIEYGGEEEGTEARVRYFGADKGAFKMSKSGGVWVGSPYNPKVYALKESNWYFYLMDPVDELVYVFYKPNGGTTRQRCHLKYLIDRNGNTLTYSGASSVPGDAQIYYTKVEDGLGRVINITGNDYDRATITDYAGRSYSRVVTVPGGRRTTIVDPMGNTTIYWMGAEWWNTGEIRKIEKPLHNVPVTNTFEQWDGGKKIAVKTQTDAYGNVTTMNGASTGSAITATAPDGSVKTYHFDGYNSSPSSLTDEANKEATFNTITRGGISGITDRMGGKTSMDYHAQTGKIASITNANNKTINNTYTAQDQTFTNPANSETATFTFYNLTRVNYPDGTNEQFTYDAKGNVLTRRDQTGKIWTYTYNGKGQVLTATNPSGGVATNTYNNDGTLASTKDSDTGITTYAYDVYKRPITVTLPGGSTIQTGYNLNDQITSITDENNNTYTYTYDANGNLTQFKDPLNNNTQYAYDLMDRVAQITDRLNKTTTMAYNNMGKLQTITDPNNLATSYAYNTRGWNTATSIGGQTWQASYNDEGIPATNTTPMNRTTTYISNNLGLLASVKNPLNQTTTLAYDSMLRKTGVTDALGRTTAFAYNQRGLLSGVTLPVVGASVYTSTTPAS